MARQAKLGRKNGHWHSAFGGKSHYFGKIEDVPHAQALKRFREALATPKPKDEPKATPTVAELMTLFLEWLERHRSTRTHYERSRHLGRFAKANGKRKVIDIDGTHLDVFLMTLAKRGAALDWQHKHEVSIRAMFRWGIKYGHVPDNFRPFAKVEPIRTPAKALLETDLPTNEEVQVLIDNATPTLAVLLRVQHATGARSGELLKAKVGDYQRGTRQIVLAHHKREKTMREPKPRVIALNDNANAIVQSLCEGRSNDAPLFVTPTGKRWSDKLLSWHFSNARTKVKGREEITPYSLRHLWISEALMAGLDVMLVARLAGTSVSMIERVYGRFKNQTYQDALAKLDASRSA